MLELKNRNDITLQDLPYLEDPFFAKATIESHLFDRGSTTQIPGLQRFLGSPVLGQRNDKKVLLQQVFNALDSGRIFLLNSKPFSPLVGGAPDRSTSRVEDNWTNNVPLLRGELKLAIQAVIAKAMPIRNLNTQHGDIIIGAEGEQPTVFDEPMDISAKSNDQVQEKRLNRNPDRAKENQVDDKRIRVRFECLKVINTAQEKKYVPIHSYRLYLFYKKAGKYYRSPENTIPAQQITENKNNAYKEADIGKCDYKFVHSATYYGYFAGKVLNDNEIIRIQDNGDSLLIRFMVNKPIVRIEQSFFWWICLLQNIESNYPKTIDVVTKVRKIFYKGKEWQSLIDSDAEPFFSVNEKEGGPVKKEKDCTLPLKILFAIGKSYFQKEDQYTNSAGVVKRFEKTHTLANKAQLKELKLAEKNDFIESSPVVRFNEIGGDGFIVLADRHNYVILPKVGGDGRVDLTAQGTIIEMGHVLAGIEVMHFDSPGYLGFIDVEYPASAATWAGDLGQAVHQAIENKKKNESLSWDLAWQESAEEKASSVQLYGDFHGYQLGPLLKSQIEQDEPLSYLLESYFHNPNAMKAEKRKFQSLFSPPGDKQVEIEVVSFAELWDTLPKRANFDKDNEDHKKLVEWAIEYMKVQIQEY